MVHTLRLDNYSTTPRKVVLGTNSSFGTESIKIERGAGWDGLNLTATWHIPGREEPLRVALLDGDAMDVPPEVTKEAKDGVLVLAGLASGVQRASCNVEYLILEQAGVYGGTDAEPTPELAAQVLEATMQAKANAEAAAQDASESKANANKAQQAAENAAADAAKAGPYAEAALNAQKAAEAARDTAISAGAYAENAANAAAGAMTAAAESASKAAASENAAAASENAAAASAVAAAGSAVQAETQKTAAAKSASDAQGYMQAASSAATAANESAENAAGSKAAAASSATASADSATAASDSAGAAAKSATAAGNSASAALGSATAASGSATAAGKSAEGAAGSAAAAKGSADAAAGSAKAAQNSAAAATAAAEEIKNAGFAVYGVYFTGSTSAGVRTGAAADFVFTPGTDTDAGANSFDAVYPWAGMRRCCCTLNADGTVRVNAYKGQPGYIEDGTNGEVLVEVPLFYVAGAIDVDPRISNTPLPGFRVPKKFVNADGSVKQRCYVRAFPGSIGADGKLHSVAWAIPSMDKTIQKNLDAARLWGDKYSIGTSADAELLLYLMVVAYGTRNVQDKVMGVVSLYQKDIAVTAATTDEAAVVCAKGALEVGNIISVGTGGENSSVARYRMVTAVEAIAGDTDNVKASFSGDAVTTTTDHKVWRIIQSTGTANSVISTCGSTVSNTDGMHSFVFYGVENPLYGNQWRMEADWKVVDGVPYICNDTNYQWRSLDGYTKMNVEFPTAESYVKNLATDERYPQLPLPKEVGASSTTYCADHFQNNIDGARIALLGGSSRDGLRAGPFCIYIYGNAGYARWSVGADLSVPD